MSNDTETLSDYGIQPVLMLSAAASPARTSAALGIEPALTVNAQGCGVRWRDWFATYDPATLSWRTSQICFTGEQAEYLVTWPRAGMTRNGNAYQRPPLVPRTSGKEF